MITGLEFLFEEQTQFLCRTWLVRVVVRCSIPSESSYSVSTGPRGRSSICRFEIPMRFGEVIYQLVEKREEISTCHHRGADASQHLVKVITGKEYGHRWWQCSVKPGRNTKLKKPLSAFAFCFFLSLASATQVMLWVSTLLFRTLLLIAKVLQQWIWSLNKRMLRWDYL
jgi:hypothetical protein